MSSQLTPNTIAENEDVLANKRILVVEDEAVIVLTIEEALNDLGYLNVSTAMTVADALQAFESNEFDLVLLDINLNDLIDGIELARIFKSKKHIPIIFLTSNSDKYTVSLAKQVEPTGFILKPFDTKNLEINLEIAFFQQTPQSKANQKQRQLAIDEYFFNNNPSLIIRIAPNKNILKINTIISRITGKQPAFYEGKTIYNAEFEDAFIKQLEPIIDNVSTRKRKTFVEATIPTIMGDRTMSIAALPEIIDGKNIDSITFSFQDITDQKISAADLVSRNKKMLDSITYSEKIQKSLLPDEDKLRQYLPNSFILFNPKDIVSGDFPWVYGRDNYVYIAVVDCTGHGVPGALLSIIFHFLLNQINKKDNDMLPSKVLDILHVFVKKNLKQHMMGIDSKDGADIGLCRVDLNTGQLDFAGAHRPLICIKNSELQEVKGDRRPIGGVQYVKKLGNTRFTNTTIQLEKGDFVAMFSDGITDQFGGEITNQRKIGSEKVKQLLLENKLHDAPTISKNIHEYYTKWKGPLKQIDDVLMIGFKWGE